MSTAAPVVVTGVTGYLASHIANNLLNKGIRVRGTARNIASSKKVSDFRTAFAAHKDNLELVEADLTSESSWRAVMSGGVRQVYHVASPFPVDNPSNEDVVVQPAVNGTLNVLKACQLSGTVQKVVLTSSCLAITDPSRPDDYVTTEKDWGTTKGPVYQKSKILAEKAAWDFMEKLPEDGKFELAVVNPGFIVGPLLYNGPCTSVEVVNMVLQRKAPRLPQLHMRAVDVRVVAEAHIRAMDNGDTSGYRHIVVQEHMWFKDLADIISKEFTPMGYRIPSKTIPNWIIKFAALFSRKAASMAPNLGRVVNLDTSRMNNVLKLEAQPINGALIEMCHSMIQLGLSKKTNMYHPPE